ncbi:MAG: ABC transporter permease subunit [Bradymonadaceae bacterium]|nr:ABC transporter permease subunit [Lujinxingiaceae bacterium]
MAIHDQNYVRYEGPLREGGGWWVIASITIRLALSFLRTKLTLLLLWVMPLISAVLIMMEYAVRSQMSQLTEQGSPGPGSVIFFMQAAMFSLAILYVACGCGIVSDDLRHRTFQLYFSRPLARWEYGLGKFLGLFILGSMVTIVPALILGTMRTAFFARTEHLNEIAADFGVGMLLLVLLTSLMSLIVMGLSSLTRRTGYVVLAFIGVLLVPLILHGIVSVATGGVDAARLWSLPGNFMMIAEMALNPEVIDDLSVPWWAPVLITLGVAAASIGALVRRVSRLDGVA